LNGRSTIFKVNGNHGVSVSSSFQFIDGEKSMKAIRVHEFGAPSVMQLEDVPNPQPGPGQIVVAIKAAGVNPVDTYIRAGTYAKKPPLPYTPGFDAGGTVEAVGEGVRNLKTGDRVWINSTISGAYAQKALCAEGNVFRLPDRLTFAQGAGVWVPYATAYYALFELAKARAGETLFVHGASGGVGTAAVQIARSLGLRVIGTAGTPKGLDLVTSQGASALNHHDPKYIDRVSELTEGRGPDVILEMLANVNLAKDLGMIGRRGRIILIGNRGTIEINPRDAMGKGASIIGMILMNLIPEETQRLAAGVAAGIETGTLTPVVGREFPLNDAARAHEAVLAPGAHGKIVLIP
jgi:NADPH2:quinone reductase